MHTAGPLSVTRLSRAYCERHLRGCGARIRPCLLHFCFLCKRNYGKYIIMDNLIAATKLTCFLQGFSVHDMGTKKRNCRKGGYSNKYLFYLLVLFCAANRICTYLNNNLPGSSFLFEPISFLAKPCEKTEGSKTLACLLGTRTTHRNVTGLL